MSKKKRKSQKLKRRAIMFGIFCGLVFVSFAIYCRIQQLGGLKLNLEVVQVIILIFCGIVTIVYVEAYFISILPAKKQEDDEENFEKLKQYLQGTEKEVLRKYNSSLDARMLKNLAKEYNIRCFARIENDEIIIVTRDNDERTGSPIRVDYGCFRENFKTE